MSQTADRLRRLADAGIVKDFWPQGHDPKPEHYRVTFVAESLGDRPVESVILSTAEIWGIEFGVALGRRAEYRHLTGKRAP